MFTREFILKRPVKLEPVPAPELGDGAVLYVKRLSGTEYMKLHEAMAKGKDKPAFSHWIIAAVCDETGAPTFLPEDLDAIIELEGTLVLRLGNAASALNGTEAVIAGK